MNPGKGKDALCRGILFIDFVPFLFNQHIFRSLESSDIKNLPPTIITKPKIGRRNKRRENPRTAITLLPLKFGVSLSPLSTVVVVASAFTFPREGRENQSRASTVPSLAVAQRGQRSRKPLQALHEHRCLQGRNITHAARELHALQAIVVVVVVVLLSLLHPASTPLVVVTALFSCSCTSSVPVPSLFAPQQ